MEIFFTIFPFVYISKCDNDTLFYNTVSGDSMIFKDNLFITEIVHRLEQQDYACVVNEDEINRLNQVDFFKLLVEKNIGYYIDKKHFPVLPLTTQSADINDPELVTNFKKNEYIIENLRELTFYINSGACNPACTNQLTIQKAHKQFLYPIYESQKNELPLSKIEKVIGELGTINVNINILGGNIFKYAHIESLIDILNGSTHNIFYYFHYTDWIEESSQQILSLINENETITILIDFPFHETWFKMWELIIKQKNVKIEFIVESDLQVTEAEKIISKYTLENYNFKPFYNDKNFDFFSENVFVSEGDILSVKASLFELITKKISNPAFFGKLTFDVHGNIYSSVNLPPVSTINNLNLKRLIHDLITDENSIWLKNKYTTEPCNHCIYNLLCPPISNYDYLLNRHNLCSVK